MTHSAFYNVASLGYCIGAWWLLAEPAWLGCEIPEVRIRKGTESGLVVLRRPGACHDVALKSEDPIKEWEANVGLCDFCAAGLSL